MKRDLNNNEYTILVSGASGIVGYGILRSLKERGDCLLIGTTIYSESPANCFADVVELVPRTDDSSYLEELMKIIKGHDVDMIIPGIESDIEFWNEHRRDIESTGAFILLNNPKLIRLCRDKWLFFEELVKYGYEGCINSSITPNFTTFKLPFILKPRCGFGSKGFVVVENETQFIGYKSSIGPELMMQELVGKDDEEYTVSAFFDSESNLKAMMGMKRKLSSSGFTEMGEVVDVNHFSEDIRQLVDIFHPVGPTNFQFRKHDGKWKLLEINPRISSSTSIRSRFGYNESSMAVDCFLAGKDIEKTEIKSGKAIRYIEDYIIYDSTDI